MISDRLKSNLIAEFDRSLLAKAGLAILLCIAFVALFAPVLATHNPTLSGNVLPEGEGFNDHGDSYPPMGVTYESFTVEDAERVPYTVEPSSDHYLGTNDIGQDIYSRFLYGARTSMLVGLVGTGLAVLIGVPFGLVSGYYGGRVDDAMMRVADVMLAFPSLVLAIALIGVFGETAVRIPDPFVELGIAEHMPPNIVIPGTVTIVVALVTWVWFARVARGEALSIRSEEYVKATRSFGMADRTILRKHVLPNAMTPVIVLGTVQVAFVILLESSLSFLGFSGTTLSWGFDIARGQDFLRTQWWISTVPGLGIVMAVISVNLLGDWLRDALDPNIEGERGG